MGADSTTTCDVFITLVHGTWPRGWLRDVLLFAGRGHRSIRPYRSGLRKVATSEIDLSLHSESAGSPLTFRRFCGRVKIPFGKETKQRASYLTTYAPGS